MNPSMAHSRMEACEIVRRLDHDGKLDESPLDKKQNAATALFHSAKPVALRVSRFRMAQILPQMKLASRALSGSYASSAMDSVRHKDFTLRKRNKRVELDAQMNLTLSHTTTNVPCCKTSLPQYGDKLPC